MYILKNAWRSISRAKVRNILIGVIVLVIATSSCVALSIREASGTAKEQYLEDMEVTAQISIDRQSMMQGFSKDSEGGFDRNSMKNMLANQESLTLEELKTYAQADSVKDFYYTGTTTVNTDDNWEAVDTTGITEETEEETEDDKSGFSSMGGGRGGQMSGQKLGRMGMQGDASKYYKYLVDENAGTYELVESFDVAYSSIVSSVQDVENNHVTSSGKSNCYAEYDEDGELIIQFNYTSQKYAYRVFKYDFCRVWFE